MRHHKPPTPNVDQAGTSSRSHGALRVLLAFLGITALGGGAALFLRPDGRLLGLTPADLATSLFRDFRWPGVILFTVFGIGGILSLYALIKGARWGPRLALAIGSGQVIWILFQTVMIQELSWLQALFFVVGVLIAGLAARVNGGVWRTP